MQRRCVALHKSIPKADFLKQKRKRYNDDRDNEPKQNGEQEDPLKDATTLYVGNLSFYTTEEQIHELFSKYVPGMVSEQGSR